MSKRRKNGANGKRRINNTGTLEKRGAKWLARWYVLDTHGNRLRKSQVIAATNLDDARRQLAELTEGNALITREKEIRRNLDQLDGVAAQLRDWNDKQPAMTLNEAWNAFDKDLSSRQRDPATQTAYEQQYGIFTRWLAETHPEITELRRIDSTVANEYANHLLGKVRGGTFNKHLNALALVWTTLAAKDSEGNPKYPEARLGGNPFAYDKRTKTGIPRVTLKRANRQHERRDLNLDEVAKLMQTAQGEMRVLIALGFYTGLRLGDCVLLKWDNIDRVNQTITTRSRKTDTETTPRMHPKLIQIISEEVKSESGYLLPELAAIYTGNSGSSLLCRKLNALFQSVGITTSYREEGKRALPDCGFHSLRHTYVTQLERVGATLAERQALAGHRSAAMTEHYTHTDGSRVLALPDITSTTPTPTEGAEARLSAFYAAWDALATDEERRQARDYMEAQNGIFELRQQQEVDHNDNA